MMICHFVSHFVPSPALQHSSHWHTRLVVASISSSVQYSTLLIYLHNLLLLPIHACSINTSILPGHEATLKHIENTLIRTEGYNIEKQYLDTYRYTSLGNTTVEINGAIPNISTPDVNFILA